MSLEPSSNRFDGINSRLRELAAVRVELPPQISLSEDRDNIDRESTEHNASNESTERIQSGRSLPSDSTRPSAAVLELMSSLAASAAERVAIPPISATPTITRTSRSPV